MNQRSPISCFLRRRLEFEEELMGVPGLAEPGRLVGYWEEDEEEGFDTVRVGGIPGDVNRFIGQGGK